jgi:hypothetical protein
MNRIIFFIGFKVKKIFCYRLRDFMASSLASNTTAVVHLLSFVMIQKKVTKKKSRKKRYPARFFHSP